jgi:prepilin-type processing-associated H-X9-DG protein
MGPPRRPQQSARSTAGFTRTDLVALTFTSGVLALMAATAIGGGSMESHAALCLSNLRRMTTAWLQNADDNNGQIVGNLDGGAASTGSNSNKTWVLGWMDYNGGTSISGMPGGLSNTNVYVLTNASPLAPYLGRSAGVFRCPVDTSLSRGSSGAPRVRSYSMNGYLGTSNPYTTGYRVLSKLSDFVNPSPAQTFVFCDERPDSINDSVLLCNMVGFDPYNPAGWIIVDYPAMYHDRGGVFAFADGHGEFKRWTDPRTVPLERAGQLIPLNVPSPNNPDVYWLQQRATSRVNAQ